MGDEGEVDHADVEGEREKVKELQSELAQKRELKRRLDDKCKALEDEKDKREGNLKMIATKLDHETRKRKDAGGSKGDGDEQGKEKTSQEYMKEEVSKLLAQRIPIMNDEEESTDDEAGAAAPKQEDDAGLAKIHDTVLVTYCCSKDKDPTRFDEYKVTYRFDKSAGGDLKICPESSATRYSQLHTDACAYWGCSPKDFGLYNLNTHLVDGSEKTKAKDDLEDLAAGVKGDICLANDEIGLDPAEHARLWLVKNMWKGEFNADSKIKDPNKSPVEVYIEWWNQRQKQAQTQAPKKEVGKDDAKKADKSKMNTPEWSDSKFVAAFTPWPGIVSLLKFRGTGEALQAWQYVRLRDFLAFVILGILVMASLQLRTPRDAYFVRQGVYNSLVTGIPAETSHEYNVVHNFEKIRRYEDIWDWMSGSFHYQVFNTSSRLHKYYKPVGRLRLRQLMAAKVDCRRLQVEPVLPKDMSCYATEVNDYQLGPQESAPTGALQELVAPDELIFKAGARLDENYDGSTPSRTGTKCPSGGGTEQDFAQPGRYCKPLHTLFTNGDPGTLNMQAHGQSSQYPIGGYAMDYSLKPQDLAQTADTLKKDLNFIKNSWLRGSTRFFAVELTVANYHFESFLACTFYVEITSSRVMIPHAEIHPFRLGVSSYDSSAQAMDIIGLVIVVVYLLLIRVYVELKHKASIQKSTLFYILSCSGFIDLSIISLYMALVAVKFRDKLPPPTNSDVRYVNYSRDAYMEHQVRVGDSMLFFLIMIRLSTFMKLSPVIFRFFKMFQMSIHMFAHYAFVFVPIVFGAVFLAHTVWHPYAEEFSNWARCFWSSLIILWQPHSIFELYERSPYLSIVWVVYFFLVISMFFKNIFMAIIVQSYFESGLLFGNSEVEQWNKDQWLDWMLPAPLYSMAAGKPPGASRKEGEDEGEDEGDSGGEDEEAEEDDGK